MQHILGIVLKDNDVELFDADIIKKSYELMGLKAAIIEAQKRKLQNPNVIQVNVYKVHNGVRSISSKGVHELVYRL
jgi:hypothetical protein